MRSGLPQPHNQQLPLLPQIDSAFISKINEMATTTMSKLFSHPINPPPLYTQTSSGSNATSTHTSATVTPTIARSVPVFSPCEDEYLEEPEVDAWCSVCDRLIKPVKVHEVEDKKLDANGIPKFIKPVPARLPSKKAKRNPSHPGLKRTNTLTKLATAAPKPTIITEAIRPSPPIPSAPAPPKYNTEIYCSVVCSDLDKVRSGQQIDELGREMEGLNWGQGRDDLPSPLWMGGSSASEGDGSQSGGEKSAKSSGADEIASPEPVSGMKDYDFGYFDMVFNGVENGLRERERRRSSQSNGQKSGLPSLMTKRNSSGYGYGYNQTVSSSDSLSSMWSASGSDGRAFSEDLSSSVYGGYGLHGRGFKGLTPMRPTPSNQSPIMNNTATLSPNSRRPSMASNRSFSFSRPSAGSPQPPPIVRQNSGVASTSMMKQASNKEGEFGSAPVSSLFHSYAAAFHRTPSSAELCRPVNISPVMKPYGSEIRPRSRRSSQIEYEAVNMGRRSSGSEMGPSRSRSSFTPVNTGILGVSLPTTETSTPTQSFVGNGELHLNTRAGSLTSSMMRSSSRDSTASSRSRPEVEAPIFEEDETQHHRHERKSSRSKSSGRRSLPRTGSFAFQDKPSTAITIGDQIFAQSPPPSRVVFGRSVSPKVTKHLSLDRMVAGSREEENASTPLARPKSTQGVQYQEKAQNQATPVSSSLSRSFTAENRNFSWNDLAAAGKVTTYELPQAAIKNKNDNSRLFYFG